MAAIASCRAWSGASMYNKGDGALVHPPTPGNTSPRVNSPEQRLSNMYTIALNELEELESEPLCHRIAARLLVNNCQLLDGQDEATVHLDSGRAARDFVDSYAASLAICDLERGSFVIPPSCSKFREATLAALPVPKHPQLHVSTLEIDDCLEGLAQSDSAWNTWVSYRHKALRFCEVSRADNEKAHNIHLYQRVTKILERLTTQIESELEERLEFINFILQGTTGSVLDFAAEVDQLRVQIDALGDIVESQLHSHIKDSDKVIKGGLEDAKNLQQILTLLLRTTMDTTAGVAASYDVALQGVSQTTARELESLTNVFAAALASSISLQSQLDTTQTKTIDILRNQVKIEAGMERLGNTAHDLLNKFDHHEERLSEAQQKAEEIMDTLEAANASAKKFGYSVFGGWGFSNLWPHFVFPAASLILGSYGLRPSIGRNLWLAVIGEFAGFVVSNMTKHRGIVFAFTESLFKHHGLSENEFSDYLNNTATKKMGLRSHSQL